MTLQSKAWEINSRNFNEPWFCPDSVYYADTVGKAKLAALRDVEDLTNKWTGEPFSFLTLQLRRAKSADKYLVDGRIRTVAQIEYDRKQKEQTDMLDKIVADNPNGYAYIKKGAYYYRPNHCGYTEFLSLAGVYTVKEAAKSVSGCSLSDHMQLILIDPAKHNEMIQERIADLQSRIITTS